MQEVDTDGDGDMDFFEFVQVANMLKDKSGRYYSKTCDEGTPQ